MMTSETNATVQGSKKNRVFEEDVPGAALSRESVEECPAVV